MATHRILEEALRKIAAGAFEVDLSAARIGDSGASRLAEALKQNATLRELHLYSNFIGDDGARALAEALKTHPTLKTLNLFRNSIGPEGAEYLAEALKQNMSLQALNLGGNVLGVGGTVALAEALPHNAVLQRLWLHSNGIGNAGARVLKKELQQNHALQWLDIGYNDVEDEDVQCQIQALLERNKVAVIVMQVTTVPATGETEDHDCDVVVTKMSGDEVLRQPLQPETMLRHVALEVAELWRAPVSKFRWVLPGPRTLGPESLDQPLLPLLQGSGQLGNIGRCPRWSQSASLGP